MSSPRRFLIVSLVAAQLFVFAGSVVAQNRYYAAHMDGAHAVPPNASPAVGHGCFWVTSPRRWLDCDVSYSGLSSPITGVQIFGPWEPGVEPSVCFWLGAIENHVIAQVGPVTPEQEAMIAGGLWYLEVTTVDYPDGEIRGQMFEISNGANPCTVPVRNSTWGSVKMMYR